MTEVVPPIPRSIELVVGCSNRIPDALKMIFIQAARDEEILEAPSDGCAFKTFERPEDRPYVRPGASRPRARSPEKMAMIKPKNKGELVGSYVPARQEREKLARRNSVGASPVRNERAKLDKGPVRRERPKLDKRGPTAVCSLFSRSVDRDEPKPRNSRGGFLCRSAHDDSDGVKPRTRAGFLSRSAHNDDGKSGGGFSLVGMSINPETRRGRKKLQSQEQQPEEENPASPLEQSPKVRKELEKQHLLDDNTDTESCTLDSSSDHSMGGLASYPTQRSPQVFLDVMLRTRGYPTTTFFTLETAYSNTPTPLQTASYHARLQEMVCKQHVSKLRATLQSGISTNPCNQHGESLLHMACRYGYDNSVKIMLDYCNASVQVSDDCGRTPLHSAFFGTTPSFDIVERLVSRDRTLLYLKDRCGATPLSYIPRDHWGVWIDFFYGRRDVFWPRRNKKVDGVAEPSELTRLKPNSLPLADPSNALTLELATMVASGKLTPEEARFMMGGSDDDDDDETSDQDSTSVCSEWLCETSVTGHSAFQPSDGSSHSAWTAVTSGKDDASTSCYTASDDYFDDAMSAATDVSGDSFA